MMEMIITVLVALPMVTIQRLGSICSETFGRYRLWVDKLGGVMGGVASAQLHRGLEAIVGECCQSFAYRYF